MRGAGVHTDGNCLFHAVEETETAQIQTLRIKGFGNEPTESKPNSGLLQGLGGQGGNLLLEREGATFSLVGTNQHTGTCILAITTSLYTKQSKSCFCALTFCRTACE